MLAESETSEFVTVVLAYVTPRPTARCAPPSRSAATRRRSCCTRTGRVEDPGRFGAILGVIHDPPLPDREFTLAPGRHDGALHRRGHRGRSAHRADRRARAGRAALAHAGADPGRLLDAVEEAVVTAQPGEPRDDIALLALAVDDAAER